MENLILIINLNKSNNFLILLSIKSSIYSFHRNTFYSPFYRLFLFGVPNVLLNKLNTVKNDY